MEQPSQQPLQKEINNQSPVKTNWKYIAIVVVLALLAVGGILVWWQMESIQESSFQIPVSQREESGRENAEIVEPQVTTEQKEFSYEGWGTYTNEEMGYTLRIPPDWITKVFIGETGEIKFAVGAQDSILQYIGDRDNYKVLDGCNVVTFSPIPSKLSVEAWIGREGALYQHGTQKKSLQIGGRQAIQFPFYFERNNQKTDGFATFVKSNDILFIIVGRGCLDQDIRFTSLYEKLLSSIVFIERKKSPASFRVEDWPLYTNSTFGYSLKLPREFIKVTDTSEETKFREERNGQRVAQLIIGVVFYEKGTPEEIQEYKELVQKLKNVSPNAEFELGDGVALKVKNVNIDGCIAHQILIEVYETDYIALCDARDLGIKFGLRIERREDVDVYMQLLDAVLSTFRF